MLTELEGLLLLVSLLLGAWRAGGNKPIFVKSVPRVPDKSIVFTTLTEKRQREVDRDG